MRKKLSKTTIQQVQTGLLSWYYKEQRKLPWRDTTDPYCIWVSEVMLQQTQVVKVIDYYNRFIKAFPTIQACADAQLENVLKLWEGLGYYSRARNFHKAIKTVKNELDSVFPREYDMFLSLPGVGDYIAAAVFSQALNQPYAVVDGNVKRVLARLFAIDNPINKTSTIREFKTLATLLLDEENPGDFNQAMMELGATICTPKKYKCQQCPLLSFCLAAKSGVQDQLPVSSERKQVPTHHISVGVIYNNEKFLIVQRKKEGLLGGLWEFPGGRLLENKKSEESCRLRIKEKTSLETGCFEHLIQVRHAYSHFKIVVDVFKCNLLGGNVSLSSHIHFKWISSDEINDYAFHQVNHKFMHLLKNVD